MQWSNYDVGWQIEAATCEGSSITSDVIGTCVVPLSPSPSDREDLDSAMIAIAVIIPLAILLIIFFIIIGIVRQKR